MNRAADAILAEQIPSSSSPFATSAQAFPPQKTHFLSPKKMDPRPLTFFTLFFTLPFLMEELLLLKSSCQLLTSFQVENWSCHIPPRIGISPNSLGVPSTPDPAQGAILVFGLQHRFRTRTETRWGRGGDEFRASSPPEST